MGVRGYESSGDHGSFKFPESEKVGKTKSLKEAQSKLEPNLVKEALNKKSDFVADIHKFAKEEYAISDTKTTPTPEKLGGVIQRGEDISKGVITPKQTEQAKRPATMDVVAKKYQEGAYRIEKLERGHLDADVFKIIDKQGHVVAYKKPGPTLELVAWELSKILGKEKMFSEVVEVPDSADGKVISSMQHPIEGAKLFDYCEEPFEHADLKAPTMEHIMDATVMSLFLGTSDCHQDNVWVGRDGELIMQDNTRSLHHSNGLYIGQRGDLKLAYRSGFLAMNESYKILTPAQKHHLNKEIAHLEAKMSDVEKYFREKVDPSKFPKGWLEVDKVIQARKEALQQMKEALASGKVNCLADFVFTTVPEAKFMTALNLIANPNTLLDMDDPLPSVFKATQDYSLGLDAMLERAANMGYDPQEIRKLCQEESGLSQFLSRLNTLEPHPENSEAYLENSKTILREGYNKAELDFKDLTEDQIKQNTLTTAKNMIEKSGLLYKKDVNLAQEKEKLKVGEAFVHEQQFMGKTALMLYQKTADGQVTRAVLDYTTKPGYVKMGNKPEMIRCDQLKNAILL